MVMTIGTFKREFPEFAEAGDKFIQSKLDAAALEINEGVWGDLADQGHGVLTAHFLGLTPKGREVALVHKSAATFGMTNYLVEYKRLQRVVYPGPQVT